MYMLLHNPWIQPILRVKLKAKLKNCHVAYMLKYYSKHNIHWGYLWNEKQFWHGVFSKKNLGQIWYAYKLNWISKIWSHQYLADVIKLDYQLLVWTSIIKSECFKVTCNGKFWITSVPSWTPYQQFQLVKISLYVEMDRPN
jgi:hypothetical protein